MPVAVEGDHVSATLEFDDPDVARHLGSKPEAERDEELVTAARIGILCVQRASNIADAEMIRRLLTETTAQISSALHETASTTRDGLGTAMDQFRERLLAQLGTEDGKVLAPVRHHTERAVAAIQAQLENVLKTFADHLDPTRETSSLGRALCGVHAMLDPNRTDSAPAAVQRTVAAMTAPDGDLVRAVRAAVDEAVQDVRRQVAEILRALGAQQREEELTEATPIKGAAYEEELAAAIAERWSHHASNVTLDHVGGDNRPGDILLTFQDDATNRAIVVVVEAKDDQQRRGQKRLHDEIAKAMMERGASAGVFIGKTRDALGASSDWYEGDSEHGPWVATTHEMRDLAIRWVVARRRLRDLSSASIDAGAMAEKAQRIKTALQNVTTVRRNLTQATNALDDMQKEIAAALGELEQAIQHGLQGNTVA